MTRRSFLSAAAAAATLHCAPGEATRISCLQSRTTGDLATRARMDASGSIHRRSTASLATVFCLRARSLRPEVQSVPRDHPDRPQYVAAEGSDQSLQHFSQRVRCLSGRLERAGYFVGMTGKGWGPGDFKATGFAHNPAGREYQQHQTEPPFKRHWENRLCAKLRDVPE